MKKWFQADIKSNQAHPETGVMRAVLTAVLIEAFSYSEVEKRVNEIIEEGEIESNGEFSISKISKSNISDVPFHFDTLVGVHAQQEAELQECDENDFDEHINWRVKTEMETILINGEDVQDAYIKLAALFQGTGVDWEVSAIQKTKIKYIFRHEG